MGKNAFYLLFAYEQTTKTGIPFYSNTAAKGAVDIRPIIKQLEDLNSFFDYESYKVFYDRKNLDSFFDTIKGGVTERRAFSRKLYGTLKANNWNANKSFAGSTTIGGTPVSGETFSYLSVRQKTCPSDVNVILDMNAIKGTISGMGSMILMPTIPAVHDWFTKNRVPKRQYHWSSKHGEYGKGNWPGESVLLGSRNEAELLLLEAIGTKGKKDLYIYDKKYAKHMRYKPENVDDAYHSFHIDESKIDPHIKAVILEKLGKI